MRYWPNARDGFVSMGLVILMVSRAESACRVVSLSNHGCRPSTRRFAAAQDEVKIFSVIASEREQFPMLRGKCSTG